MQSRCSCQGYIHSGTLCPLNVQEMRTAPELDNDANKATLKKHVVRAINNLANKDVKPGEGSTGRGTQSCSQQSGAGASTFSRSAVVALTACLVVADSMFLLCFHGFFPIGIYQ